MRPDPLCPVCASGDTTLFLERADVPVHQNLVLADPALARAVPRGDLSMRVCSGCGFVFNSAFDLSRLAYGQDYDNTQSHSPMFDTYLDDLVRQLVETHGVRNAQIVEVGCGKGHFLRKLVTAQDAGNTGFGFDPSYAGPLSELGGALQFRRSFYDGGCTDVPADVVVCRHVIEHVPDPLRLLGSVRAALGRQPHAQVFFETPCVEWILRHQVVWDFFYEHCSLFSAAALRVAFERCGFACDAVDPVFGGQYLWLRGQPAASSRRPATSGAEVAALAQAYGMHERARRASWHARLLQLRAHGPVALWGAGAKGVTFANLVDSGHALIDCVVDINPAKQGCFVPGSAHPIVAPGELAGRGVRNVILMNPNYRQEVLQLLQSRHVPANLIDWS
ncbi:MAG: class I SAM-dependent methyltransferase [Rhodoferax sp.]|nr:class I SAM-dependent methyltransferase [Rhodoferax sp.]